MLDRLSDIPMDEFAKLQKKINEKGNEKIYTRRLFIKDYLIFSIKNLYK
jgi:hypothetical protein